MNTAKIQLITFSHQEITGFPDSDATGPLHSRALQWIRHIRRSPNGSGKILLDGGSGNRQTRHRRRQRPVVGMATPNAAVENSWYTKWIELRRQAWICQLPC